AITRALASAGLVVQSNAIRATCRKRPPDGYSGEDCLLGTENEREAELGPCSGDGCLQLDRIAEHAADRARRRRGGRNAWRRQHRWRLRGGGQLLRCVR